MRRRVDEPIRGRSSVKRSEIWCWIKLWRFEARTGEEKGMAVCLIPLVVEVYRCSLMQKKMKEEGEERVMENSADVVEVDE